MRHRCHLAVVEVGQRDAHIDGTTREWHVIARLEGTLHSRGLLGSEPLLEQRREGMDVEQTARRVICQTYLSVTTQRNVRQPTPTACPTGR